MSTPKSNQQCKLICWAVAAVIGIIAFVSMLQFLPFLLAFLLGAGFVAVLGYWFTYHFCGALAKTAAPDVEAETVAEAEAPAVAETDPEPEPEPVAEPSPAPAPVTEPAPEPVVEEAPAVVENTAEDAPVEEPQEEVAVEAPAAPAEPEETSAEAPVETPAETPAEPTAEAEPEILSAARGGKADDLKKIKGVGPKLEQTLNELGFYHYDQIAVWTEAEIAWVDARLKFKGRITRDNWIDQAKLLAGGGETDFSKRVDDGNVY